jgi:YD repeat-containing protein
MGFTLSWDAEDRVKTISFHGTQRRVEYDYDGLGRRARIRLMESSVKIAEYVYIWDDLLLCEKRDSTAPGFPVAIDYPQGERKFPAPTSTPSIFEIDSVRCGKPPATQRT